MVANENALARLLSDADPATLRLVTEQFALMAEDDPGAVESLARSSHPRIARAAGGVLMDLQGRAARDDFSLLCHFGGDQFDIEQAAWLLARALHSDMPTAEHEERVNEWGIEFLSRIYGATSNVDRVLLLGRFLSGELRFRGNSACYYCEENSLLPHILSTRLGIPITLSLLYILVGSRAAMKIEGINLPGHFIARHGEVFFDPFHGGRILNREDLRGILDRQGIEFRESHLLPATPRQFLMRILANLLYVYEMDTDGERHALVKGWMDAISCGVAAR
jgi:regulator of sirC expression with transglutaminase-like and TPR domain